MTTLVKKQVKQYGPKSYTENGATYRITAFVRHDDQCGNGHNTFSITGQIDVFSGGKWRDGAGGCIHDEIAKHFPALAPLIKWHLVSTDGPMHYIANAVYHAEDRDCWGLQAGEKRQIRNGKSGLLAWELTTLDGRPTTAKGVEKYVDAESQPPAPLEGLIYSPWYKIGEGKERDLDAARNCAVWPEATDEELTAPGLEERLKERLPALMVEFRRAVESIGLIY